VSNERNKTPLNQQIPVGLIRLLVGNPWYYKITWGNDFWAHGQWYFAE